MSSNIIVISGPSGSGKTTLIRRLLREHHDIVFSVSHTTRPRRQKEIHGVDYYFVAEKEFLHMIDNQEFVEWARVYRHYYGTSLAELHNKARGDRHLILDVDVQGAKSIKEKFPQSLFIFVVPPNLEELKNRLVRREKEINSNIENRLAVAREELKHYPLYDYVVINDEVKKAVRVLKSIYIAYKNSTRKGEELIKSMIEGSKG